MKSFFSLVLLCSIFSAHAQIGVGQEVMESDGKMEIKTVKGIANGEYLLSDDQWYTDDQIHELQEELNGISLDEEVLDVFRGEKVFKTVDAIAAGLYKLSDGEWYNPMYIRKLQTELNGIKVGDRVLETYKRRDIKTVHRIADGQYQLSDGRWYGQEHVHYLEE